MPVDFTPQATPVAVSNQAAAPRLPHISNAPFFLMYHPLRWSWDEETGDFLPNLGKMALEPGVGAVDKTGDSSLAETIRGKQGWQILPWNLVPPGTPGSSYLKSYPAKGPPTSDRYHCEIWETPKALAGRVMESEIDLAGRKAWLRWLVAEGHVPPMSAEARQYHVARSREALQRLQGNADKIPEIVGPRIEAAQSRIERMEQGPAAPKRGKKGPEASP